MTEIGLTEAMASRLADYAEALRVSPHNLLSAKGLEELEARHLPESVAFAQSLPPTQRLLDVGSGGGLPGLVIAIVRPEIEVHLMEATGKKARFLAEFAAAQQLPLTVHHARAEEHARSALAGSFDIVTARAVAPLVRLVGWCAPYLRPGGRLLAIKGGRWASELQEAGDAIRAAGLEVVATPEAEATGASASGPLVVVLERREGPRRGMIGRSTKSAR